MRGARSGGERQRRTVLRSFQLAIMPLAGGSRGGCAEPDIHLLSQDR